MDSAKYARHIGRVGALAVALGVGAAVASGYGTGVAWADDTGGGDQGSVSADPSSESASPAAQDPAVEQTSVAGSGDAGQQAGAGGGPSAPAMNVGSSGGQNNSTNDRGQSTDSNAGEAEKADKEEIEEAVDAEADPVEPVDGSQEPTLPQVEVVQADSKTASHDTASAGVQSAETLEAAALHSRSKTDADVVSASAERVGDEQTRSAVSGDDTTDLHAFATVVDESFSTNAAVADTATDQVSVQAADAVMGLPGALVSLATSVVSLLLSPFIAPGPTAPAEPPLFWAILGFVQREIQRVFFNQTPAVVDISLTAEEDTPITFDPRQGVHDAEGDAVTVSFTQPPAAAGVVTQNADGTLTFTPAENFNGEVSFTYTVRDQGFNILTDVIRLLTGQGPRTSTATVTLTVNPVDDVRNIDVFIDEDSGPIGIDLLFGENDPDGTAQITGVTSSAQRGETVSISEDRKSLIYTPGPDFAGVDVLTYTVTDATGEEYTATVTMTVVDVADTEVVQNVPLGNTVTGGLAVSADGKHAYVPTAGGVTVLDRDDATAQWKVGTRIDIGADAKDIVVDRDWAYVSREDGKVSVIDLVTNLEIDIDAETEELDRLDLGDVADMAVVEAGLRFDVGFLYTVGSGGTVRAIETGTWRRVASIELDMAAQQSAAARVVNGTTRPLIEASPDGSKLYIAYRGELHVIETTRQALGLSADDAAERSAAVRELRVVDRKFVGGDVTAMALSKDGGRLYLGTLGDDIAKVERYDLGAEVIKVRETQLDSLVRDIAVLQNENRLVVSTDRTTELRDASAMTRVETISTVAARVSVIPTVAGAVAANVILLSVVDTDEIQVVNTTAGDQPVVVNPDTASVDEDGTVDIDVLANDQGSNLIPRVVVGPRNGTAIVNEAGTVTYTPNPDFNGEDTFTYTADSGDQLGNVTTVTVTVNPVTDVPIALNDTASTGQDNGVTIDVLANDTHGDGTAITVSSVSAPANGTATLNTDGTVTYRPNAGFSGTDTFSYTVFDGTSSSTADVVVTVTPAVTITLTWNDTPRDLDAHLVGPGYHIYYGSQIYNVDGTTGETDADRVAYMMGDDTDGLGPEVTQINTRIPGEYLYYVHNFSGDGTLAASSATVTVHDPLNGPQATTFTVNPEAEGDYWTVFRLTISPTGEVTITPADEYGDIEPIESGSELPVEA